MAVHFAQTISGILKMEWLANMRGFQWILVKIFDEAISHDTDELVTIIVNQHLWETLKR